MFIRRFGGFWLVLGLGLVSILTPGRSEAEVLAQSTFDTDSDGWVVKDLAYPSPGAPPVPLGTFNPTYHGTGGNPGGYLSLSDPTGNTWFWNAPSKFLGNKQAAYGGTLSFDLAVTGAGTPFDEEDVILRRDLRRLNGEDVPNHPGVRRFGTTCPRRERPSSTSSAVRTPCIA